MAIDSIAPGDHVLFYHEGRLFTGGIIERAFEETAVGELTWNQSNSRHIYTIYEFTDDVPSIERVWELVGYEGCQVVQGFSRVANKRVSSIRNEHGSVDSALFDGDGLNPTREEVDQQKGSIQQAIQSDPELIDKETQYTETRQKARNSAFRNLIREARNLCCLWNSA